MGAARGASAKDRIYSTRFQHPFSFLPHAFGRLLGPYMSKRQILEVRQ